MDMSQPTHTEGSAEPRSRLPDTRTVADFLGVPEGTMIAWRYRGTGPRYVRVGRHVRYRWGDVDRWVALQIEGGAS